MITTDGRAGIREDGVGKVHMVKKSDCVWGRDEHRVAMLQRRAAKQLSVELEIAMLVPRDVVRGRKRTLQTESILKADCRLAMKDGAIQKPEHIFVTYLTSKGQRRRRRVVGDVEPKPRKKRAAKPAEISA